MQGTTKSRLGRLLSSVAAGTVLVLAAGAAEAQTATTGTPDQQAATSDQTGDVIVVQGFRASLRNSVNLKRNATSIVEAVSAEEIGKLPDNSIGESLARLPGLASQRLFGRAQQISIRGLSPDFSTALLNGREQVSVGDNRGVEYDQYPSELLTSVLVYKTPDAALIGQGLAGTVDMRTVRPLSYTNRVFSISGRYEQDEIGELTEGSDNKGYRFTGSYIDHSADGVWGWALGAAVMSSPTQAERWEAWGYANGDGTNPVGQPVPGNDLVLGGAKPYVQSSELDRNGYLGVLQFRPSDTFQSTLDVFYSKFTEDQHLRGIEIPLWWDCSQGCGVTMQPGWTAEGNLVTQGTFNPVEDVTRNDFRGRDSELRAVGWNTQIAAGPNWTLTTDLSYSYAERHDTDLETWAGTASGADTGAGDTLSYTLHGEAGATFTHTFNYADPTLILLTDPAGWGSVGYLKKPNTYDELDALRVSAARDFSGIINNAEFGVNYSERDKTKVVDEWFLRLTGNPAGNAEQLPANLMLPCTHLDFIGMGCSLSFDPEAAIAAGVYTLEPNVNNTDIARKSWDVDEHVTILYAKFGVDTTLMALPLTGNFGLQAVHTDQSSTGGVLDPVLGHSVTAGGGTTYNEFLPSLNLTLELSDNQRLRLGIARTLSRPRMDDERASFSVSYNTGNINNTDPNQSYWGGSGGNPNLKPWIANSFDLSYEHYLGGEGYFALALFYKNLETYIFNQNTLFDFTGYPVNQPGDNPATHFGVASIPQNGHGGYVEGAEFTVQLPGEVIAQALDGFGIQLNASDTKSNIRPPGNPGQELPGLSKTVVNTTLYYERYGFEFRVSDRYRSSFLGEVTGFGADRTLREVKGESVLDAQIGYRFDDGPLQGLAFQIQGNNLTDEPFITYANDDERQVLDYQRYGRVFLFGVSYRR
ncbi:MAG: TonB-dependent receptor [Terricaulis silvestris]